MSEIKYTSDCCNAPIVGEIIDDMGRCSECKEWSWAADPEMLKPVSLDSLKKYVPNKKQVA